VREFGALLHGYGFLADQEPLPRSDPSSRELASAKRSNPSARMSSSWSRAIARFGHAVDAARYGALSRPPPSEEPPPPLEDERAEALRQTYVRDRERSEEMEFEQYEDSLYEGWP
jgi:hypothetical protein